MRFSNPRAEIYRQLFLNKAGIGVRGASFRYLDARDCALAEGGIAEASVDASLLKLQRCAYDEKGAARSASRA